MCFLLLIRTNIQCIDACLKVLGIWCYSLLQWQQESFSAETCCSLTIWILFRFMLNRTITQNVLPEKEPLLYNMLYQITVQILLFRWIPNTKCSSELPRLEKVELRRSSKSCHISEMLFQHSFKKLPSNSKGVDIRSPSAGQAFFVDFDYLKVDNLEAPEKYFLIMPSGMLIPMFKLLKWFHIRKVKPLANMSCFMFWGVW